MLLKFSPELVCHIKILCLRSTEDLYRSTGDSRTYGTIHFLTLLRLLAENLAWLVSEFQWSGMSKQQAQRELLSIDRSRELLEDFLEYIENEKQRDLCGYVRYLSNMSSSFWSDVLYAQISSTAAFELCQEARKLTKTCERHIGKLNTALDLPLKRIAAFRRTHASCHLTEKM